MPTYYDVLYALIITKNHISQPVKIGEKTYSINDIYDSCLKRHKTKHHDSYFTDLIIKWNNLKPELEKIPISEDTIDKSRYPVRYQYLRDIKNAVSSYDADTLIICLIVVKFKIAEFTLPPNGENSTDPAIKNAWLEIKYLNEDRWGIVTSINNEIYSRNNTLPIFTFISGNPIKKEYQLGGRQRSRTRGKSRSRDTLQPSKSRGKSRARGKSRKRTR